MSNSTMMRQYRSCKVPFQDDKCDNQDTSSLWLSILMTWDQDLREDITSLCNRLALLGFEPSDNEIYKIIRSEMTHSIDKLKNIASKKEGE